ncbi:unnamed protein product, partial [Laminaria digitata]
MLRRGRECTLRTAQPTTRGVVVATCRAAFAACNLLSCSHHHARFVSKSAGHLQVHHRVASTSTNMKIEVDFPRAAGVKPVRTFSARSRSSALRCSSSCKTWLHSSSSCSTSSPSTDPSPTRGEPEMNWNLGERSTTAAVAAAVHGSEGGATAAATGAGAGEGATATTAMTLQEYIALGPPRLRQQQQQQQQQQRQRRPLPQSDHKNKTAAGPAAAAVGAAAGGAGASPTPTPTPTPPAGGGGLTEGELEDWLAASVDVAKSLGIDPATSTEPQRRRVFHLYLPVYFWLKHLLATRPLPTHP